MRKWNLILKLAVAGVVVLGASGCVGNKTPAHKKAVNKANERWLSMRSGLMLQMAQQQFDTGDLEQAEKTLAEALSFDPKNPGLHILAGRVALEHGQLERGYKRLATAIELNEKHPAAHYYQGIILQRWQRYDEALAAYQKSYELQTDNPAYLLAISEMLVATDKMDEAIALLESKVTYFDQNAGIRAGLGDLMIARRQYAKAADYYHQAALLRPDDMGIVEDLAAAQLEAGQTADAIRNLEKLTSDEKRAERRDLQRLLAKAYEDAGRVGDARDVYVKLTRTDPGDVEAWLQLGQIAWSQNDISGALLAANRATALAPKRHEGYLLTGMVWQKRGRTDEAVRNFDRAAELAPTVSEPVILRGIALQQAGKTAAAAEAYAEALRRQPNDARAQSLLASVEVK